MKWLFGWLTIWHCRPPKPSEVTSKDSEVNKGEDHKLIPKSRVGVGLGLILGTGLGLGPWPTRGWSRNCVRANSQSHYHGDLWGICPLSLDGPPPRRRVSFHSPNNLRDPVKKEVSCSTEPSMDDLETWLEFQAGQAPPCGGKNRELCLVLRIGISSHGRLGHHSMFRWSSWGCPWNGVTLHPQSPGFWIEVPFIWKSLPIRMWDNGQSFWQ